MRYLQTHISSVFAPSTKFSNGAPVKAGSKNCGLIPFGPDAASGIREYYDHCSTGGEESMRG